MHTYETWYAAEQRLLLGALARHHLTPFHLAPFWLLGEVPPRGFAVFKAPKLNAEEVERMSALLSAARDKSIERRKASFASTMVSLLLFEALFPQDFPVPREKLGRLLESWVPSLEPYESVVDAWMGMASPVYEAAWDMRVRECVRVAEHSAGAASRSHPAEKARG